MRDWRRTATWIPVGRLLGRKVRACTCRQTSGRPEPYADSHSGRRRENTHRATRFDVSAGRRGLVTAARPGGGLASSSAFSTRCRACSLRFRASRPVTFGSVRRSRTGDGGESMNWRFTLVAVRRLEGPGTRLVRAGWRRRCTRPPDAAAPPRVPQSTSVLPRAGPGRETPSAASNLLEVGRAGHQASRASAWFRKVKTVGTRDLSARSASSWRCVSKRGASLIVTAPIRRHGCRRPASADPGPA